MTIKRRVIAIGDARYAIANHDDFLLLIKRTSQPTRGRAKPQANENAALYVAANPAFRIDLRRAYASVSALSNECAVMVSGLQFRADLLTRALHHLRGCKPAPETIDGALVKCLGMQGFITVLVLACGDRRAVVAGMNFTTIELLPVVEAEVAT